jgi:hypothetical protein
MERKEKDIFGKRSLDLLFIAVQSSPTCSKFQSSRGVLLTPSVRLLSMTPLIEEEDGLIERRLLVHLFRSPYRSTPQRSHRPLTDVREPP